MAQNQYVVTLPDGLDEDGIINYLERNVDLFKEAFDLDVKRYNDRADFTEFTINNIQVEDDGIQIDYTVHYDVYQGCKDMLNEGSNDSLIVIGERDGNKIIFDEADPYVPRSTHDEL